MHRPLSYFRNATAVIYEYDETDAESFAEITSLVELVNSFSMEYLIFFLIGNKNDLVEAGTPRAVTDEQVQDMENTFMTKAMHVSAQTGAGCEEAFNYISQIIIQQFVFTLQTFYCYYYYVVYHALLSIIQWKRRRACFRGERAYGS